MIKVLLADDQELIRQSLSFVMSKQEDIEMVGTAANGCEALELVEEKQPDVVLLDIRMPEMDGVECTRRIKQEFPGIKVIILTTFDDDDYVFDALRYGASGYLLKGVSVDGLTNAVREAARGGSIIAPDVASKVLQMFSRMAQGDVQVRVNKKNALELTKMERQVIREVGCGLSNKEIAGRLYLSEGTVRNYISSILRKLELRDPHPAGHLGGAEPEQPAGGRRMSRYWKAALPFLLAAVIILAAASRPVVLHIGFPCDSYWNVPGENYYTFIDAAIEKFEAEHPNVKVEYTSGIRVEDYTEWLSGQYLLGQEPDVMVILPEDLVIFSDTASLRELDPFMKQDPEADLSGFYPAALQAGADKGKQYALPLECVPQMMFINKTLLQKEHIRIPDNDWTWDEFYSLCEQLTRDTDGDGIVDQFGVYDYGWEEALVANGCSLFSEDGQHCLLNQSAQESAMQFARKIYQLNAGTDLSEKTFDEGRVAFRPMLFSEYRSYEPYPWRIKRSSNFEWDCIAMPSGTSVGGGNYSRLSTLMLGISQRTKHSRLSWELLKTIACTEEMQTMVYTELSGVSALHSVTESDEVARLLQLDSQDTASRGMSTLPAIMEDTLATPRFARYHQAMESADRLITEAMSADKNFELQLLQIQQQLDVTLTS